MRDPPFWRLLSHSNLNDTRNWQKFQKVVASSRKADSPSKQNLLLLASEEWSIFVHRAVQTIQSLFDSVSNNLFWRFHLVSNLFWRFHKWGWRQSGNKDCSTALGTVALVRTILLLLFLRLYLVVVVVSCSFPSPASSALDHLEQLDRILGSETVFTQVALDVGVPAAWFTRMPRCSILLMVVVSHLDFYFRCNRLIVQILACLRVWKSRGSSAVFSGASCLAFPPCS